MGFFTPPRYVFGPGAVEQLSALDARRPTVVVDPRLAEDPRTRRIVEELGKLEVEVRLLTAPPGPPSVAGGNELGTQLAVGSPDWIVVVGGGTTIDLARAAWLRYERPDLPLESISPLTELGLRAKARMVVIPTTSGSGAESSGSVPLSVPGVGSVRPTSRELIPDWVLLDPRFPGSMPPEVTADSGAQALGHALESLVSAWTNPISEAMARESTMVLIRNLGKVAKDPSDGDLRTTVHHAAALAGLAAANAYDGATSALAEALAPAIGLTYGRCVGILLPYVLEFNYPSARDAYQALGPLLPEGSIGHRTDLARKVRQVGDLLGIPRDLRGAGVSAEQLQSVQGAVAARAARSGAALSNPRVPSEGELGRLLEAAFRGTPVDF